MIAALVIALAIFLAVRVLARKYVSRAAASLAAIAAAALFVAGVAASPLLFGGGPAPAPVSAPVAASSPAAAPVTPPGPLDVSAKCRRGAALKKGAFASFDGMSIDVTRVLVTPGTVLAPSDVVVATGWAVDDGKKRPAVAACLVIDGAIDQTAQSVIGIARPDVAAAANDPGLTNSGYSISFSPHGLSSGAHTVQVAALSRDGTYTLTAAKTIRVR